MLPVYPCLINWKLHQAHDWAYTSTDGGHMVALGSTDEKGYTEWHCLGLSHTPRHRGYESHQYRITRALDYKAKRRGTPVEESDLTTLDGVPVI